MSIEQTTCLCGCGRSPRQGNQWIKGHNGVRNRGCRRVMVGRVPDELLRATDAEIAWAAGLFEGEGSVFAERRDGAARDYVTVRMSLCSTDKDTVERFQTIMGGRVGFQKRQTENRKDQWKWVCYSHEAAEAVFALFKPWLCERRRQQFENALTEVAAVRASVVS